MAWRARCASTHSMPRVMSSCLMRAAWPTFTSTSPISGASER
jgi:hypothetical protein